MTVRLFRWECHTSCRAAEQHTLSLYFILDGELTVLDKDDNVIEVLGKYDSMHFAAGEGKQILNKTNYITTMLVIASPLPKMD